MATSTASDAAAGRAERTVTTTRSDVRAARRSKVASVWLVLVLLAVGVFAVVESPLTAAAAEEAVAESSLSDDYWRAATAVAAEESLERKYRLEPGADVRVRFDQSAAALVTALVEIQTQRGCLGPDAGVPGDRAARQVPRGDRPDVRRDRPW